MQLTRLEVRQLRRFREPYVLSDLAPGLNIIAGPNEAGKSTLVRALRALFFERHRSRTVTDLQPWGDSGAAPEVLAEFIWQGVPWQLSKRFIHRRRFDLRRGTESFDGEAAEDLVAELLGYRYASRGSSRAEHWGVPGLLWIDQGSGQELRDAASHAAPHLRSALGNDTSALGSDVGDAILAQVEEARSQLLTPTGRPTGEYARLLAEQRADEVTLEELQARSRQYRHDADRLAELRAQHDAERRDPPWQTLRAEQHSVRQALDEVRRWQEETQQHARRLESLEHRGALLQLRLDEHQRQAQRHRERSEARAQAQTRVTEAEAAVVQAEKMARETQQQERLAHEALAQGEQAAENERVQREHQQLQDAHQRANHALQEAERAATTLRSLQEQLAAVQIDASAVKALRELAQQRDGLAVQWQQSVTRLAFHLPDGGVSLDGETLQGSGKLELTETTELQLANGGTLQIIPAHQDLSALQREAETMTLRWQQMLDALGVRHLNEAEERLEQTRALNEELRHHQRLLDSLAPDGLARLQEHLATLQGRLLPLAEQIRRLTTPEPKPDPAQPSPDLAPLRAQALAATQAREQAESRWRSKEQELAMARHATQAAEEEWRREQAQATAVADEQLAAWREELRVVNSEQHSLAQQQTERAARIEAARPTLLTQDLERLERSAKLLEERFQTREVEIANLTGQLRAAQAEGLDETLAELRGQVEQRERHLNELQRRAQALALLHERLQTHRTASIQALQAPLQQHLLHYLHLLFPAATMHLDEQLIPTHIAREALDEGALGELEALSFGAREQLGLITRLAYADLLREAGHPTLIVLDDVLTHSDSQRLAAMKRVLYDAATRHQILLFTCHAGQWQDLGVAPRMLPAPGP